jgi:hypothetical protein
MKFELVEPAEPERRPDHSGTPFSDDRNTDDPVAALLDAGREAQAAVGAVGEAADTALARLAAALARRDAGGK